MKKINKRGQAALYIAFIIASIIIIMIAAVVSPIGVDISTKLYAAGEDLLLDTQANTLPDIQNAAIRNSINSTLADATATTQTNIDALTFLYKYGWVLVIVALLLIIFIATRRATEFQNSMV